MSDGLREVKIEVRRESEDSRSVDVYVFDGAQRTGRYQVRTNTDGRRDIYYSDIEGGSFNGTRKVKKPAEPDSELDPIAASIATDLAGHGLHAPALLEPGLHI